MIDELLYWMQSNFFWVAFFAIFAWAFFGFFRKRKLSEKVIQRTKDTEQQAQQAGLKVAQSVTGRTANTGSGTAIEGETNYSGNTGGIEWALTSTVRLTASHSSSSANTRNLDVWRRSTRWRTKAAAWPPGKFLMLMAAPGYDSAKSPAKKGGGFFSKIVQAVGNFALDFYVGGYFGGEYKKLVNLGDDGVKIEQSALKGFFILSNHEALANKFLDEGTITTITNWRKAELGFASEGQVDNFGVLFCEDGVILGCQADMANAQEAKMLAEFGAALAVKMQQTISS
jgi:hypothetical protein